MQWFPPGLQRRAKGVQGRGVRVSAKIFRDVSGVGRRCYGVGTYRVGYAIGDEMACRRRRHLRCRLWSTCRSNDAVKALNSAAEGSHINFKQLFTLGVLLQLCLCAVDRRPAILTADQSHEIFTNRQAGAGWCSVRADVYLVVYYQLGSVAGHVWCPILAMTAAVSTRAGLHSRLQASTTVQGVK
jgi:hypothetical protein